MQNVVCVIFFRE